jgi:hypothetical protein
MFLFTTGTILRELSSTWLKTTNIVLLVRRYGRSQLMHDTTVKIFGLYLISEIYIYFHFRLQALDRIKFLLDEIHLNYM